MPESSKEERNIVQIFKHAEYDDKNITNDLALLKLEKPVKFDKYIQPICLNKQDDYSDGTKMAVLAGWGRTSAFGLPSRVLRHGTMTVWKNEECSKKYELLGADDIPKIESTMVCAGSPGVDACQGDSGGPLFMKRDAQGHYEQIGVVSWGIGCGLFPGVYTRVDKYLDWINTNRGLGNENSIESNANAQN
ncbi:unnamed protein product [Allacma fusca]|uniref:Peptidase S1 domain-containing protein n=1 Tax=Allacma fusca TaxID=39272 RepID=A0A8J2PSV8_9HEXA|nr:unnamed protein product [Allacma fusca]